MELRAAAAVLLLTLFPQEEKRLPTWAREDRVVAAVYTAGSKDAAAYRRDFREMARAAVDVALIATRDGGLPAALVEALEGLERDRQAAPRLAPHVTLAPADDLAFLGGALRAFTSRLPARFAARVGGRAVVWLGTPPEKFQADRPSWEALLAAAGGPYLVADAGWKEAPAERTFSAGGRDHPVVVVGPGAENDEGKAYERAWYVAIKSAPKWIAVESWGAVCECDAHGKTAAELTRKYAKAFKLADTVTLPKGKWTGASKVLYTLAYTPRDQGVRPVKTEDGPFEVVEMAGVTMLTSKDPRRGPLRRVAFDVDDSFCFFDKRSFRVTVEYLDTGEGRFWLEYDSADAKRAPAERAVKPCEEKRFGGTGEWKREGFDLPDAVFANGQPGGGDFRLVVEKRGIAVRLVAVESR